MSHTPGISRPLAGVLFNPQSAARGRELRVSGDTARRKPRQWPWWRVGRMAASGPGRDPAEERPDSTGQGAG